jgi:hypothetical protein
MTLFTHTVSSAALLKLVDQISPLSFPLHIYCIFVIGSIFPDIIEMFFVKLNFAKFNEIHRKFFHLPLLYILLLIFHFILLSFNTKYNTIILFNNTVYLNTIILFILLGSLFHLLEDVFSPSGLPNIKFKNYKIIFSKFKFKTLYVTGGYREGIFFLICLIYLFI